MGGVNSIQKINYEDVQYVINNAQSLQHTSYVLINTLNSNKQSCLIKNTINYNEEETIINNLLTKDKNIYIIIYGENNNDDKVIEKYIQLYNLGFNNTYIYLGGLFEWLLLQDIYGTDLFPTTTTKNNNALIYKSNKLFNNSLLMIDD